MNRKREMPKIIKDVGFDFSWDEEKLWELDAPAEEMDMSELEWHFDLPFWDKLGGYYDLKPNEVLQNPNIYKEEFERTKNADMTYSLDVMFWKNRWLLLDGLHRLVKAKMMGYTKVKVRKIPQEAIPKIRKRENK